MSDAEADLFQAALTSISNDMRSVGMREGILACAKHLRQRGHTNAADELTEHAREIGRSEAEQEARYRADQMAYDEPLQGVIYP